MAGVLAVGDVADPVQLVLDLPWAADDGAQLVRVDPVGGVAGDAQYGDCRAVGSVQVGQVAFDQECLREVGEG